MTDNSGLVRFSLAANAGATLSQSLPSLFTLCVGGLLGPAAAGLYRIAQIVVDSVVAPAELAMRSFLPEVTRLRSHDRSEFRALVGRALFLSAGLGLALTALVALAGPTLMVAFTVMLAVARRLL